MEDSVFSSIKSNKMNEVKDIKADIKRKILKPIYFLMGEESLFINERIKIFNVSIKN
jgi:DNA polymerase III delta subunit